MTKISFGDVLSECFGFFFANLSAFFHLVTIPWMLSVLLRIAFDLLDSDLLIMVLIEKTIDTLPTIMFLVGWMRFTLLGPAHVRKLPGLGWSAHETSFLLQFIRIAGTALVLFAAFTLVAGPINTAMLGQPLDPETAQREAFAAPLAVGFFVSSLLALRVSFALAAPAVGLAYSPRQAWAASRGNAWAIIGILFVIFFAGGIATIVGMLVPSALVRGLFQADVAATVIAWIAGSLISYGGAALAATAQTVIFRRLTGWRPGVPLPTAT